jgi:hypothetical protein
MIRRKELVNPATHVRDARLYMVVVEGAKTEWNYFHALQKQDFIPKDRVHIEPAKPQEHKSSPKHLIACAEEKFNAITNRLIDDECWIVFDVESLSRNDKREQQVREAIDVARDQKWFVALSNPCFEVWYLLHITDDLTGIDGTGNSAKDTLRKRLGGYRESNVPQPCLDRQAIQLAITRAKTRDTDPNSPIPELPGTRVYRLVERLLGARVA